MYNAHINLRFDHILVLRFRPEFFCKFSPKGGKKRFQVWKQIDSSLIRLKRIKKRAFYVYSSKYTLAVRINDLN